MGLETSKRGLSVQQSALYTTGHNISNANTVGYSRQRVNMEATAGFPGIGMNSPKIPGYLGTGAQAGAITRIRDQFIDTQFRQETTKLGYWGSKTEAISQIEDVVTEPSEYGLNKAFDEFYAAMQTLSTSPESSATRQVAVEKAASLADSFNYLTTQISQIQSNLKNQINVETKNVNSILTQLAQLNEQIKTTEVNGYLPNDLYDARDLLVDELSQYMPISIEKVASGGNAKDIAEGSYTISMKTADGTSVKLVEGNKASTLTAQTEIKDAAGAISNPDFDGSDTFMPFAQFTSSLDGTVIKMGNMPEGMGMLKSLTNSYGYVETNAAGDMSTKGLLSDTLASFDKLAYEFATAFNEIHKSGYTYEEKDAAGNVITPSVLGGEFFVPIDPSKPLSASNMKVSDALKNFNLVAVSSRPGEAGNGENAIAMSNLKTKLLVGLGNASTQTFYQGMIGDIGVKGQQAIKMASNSTNLQLTISNNRASVSSVSLDEEMTNMVMFQQAYNASARMITVMDETLDKIINGMGRVGL